MEATPVTRGEEAHAEEHGAELTTVAGAALTPEHEADLTAEAEEGFDPAALLRRTLERGRLDATP